ncbi:uncharacterized protein LOC103697527 isoform X2 [Phoenix dactylifera]|uniref:Uncharacterized protein LOC103697527 isoform X2 n=1 Tax=Phoenix dactylifera TaxID=42345 RepID=A0A8B8J0F8_PHODC|nr:uncharacterized protein LOC103697527 isoform X2 [Phoenix dactylifera]
MEALTSAAVSPPTSTRRSTRDSSLLRPPPRRHRPHLAASSRLPCHRLPALCSLGLPPSPVPISGGGRWRRSLVACASSSSSLAGGDEGEDEEEAGEGRGVGDDDLERALAMDASIPGSSQEFVRRVSSRAYDMRRNLMQTIDSISYDVLESNPWREDSKPVYVLAQRDNQLWTMKTRRSRRSVKLKGSLICYSLKEESGDQQLAIKLHIQVLAQNFTCLLKISGKECLCLKMRMMPQDTVTCYREEDRVVKALQN